MMKIRNKKTGEIWDIGKVLSNDYPCWETLTQLCEDWEDAKEPLIKDEKIRKAVRVWTEAIGATKNIVFDGSKKIYSFFYENNKGGFEKLLIYGDNDLEELKRYTIAELCGEEEE